LATGNPGKLRELQQLTAHDPLDWCCLSEFPNVSEAIEDGHTFLENATKKAMHYARATGLPALADDSGLVVDGLGGEPGVHSAYYAGLPRDDRANNQKLVSAIAPLSEADRSARFCCVMVFATADGVLAESTGAIEGRVIETPRGLNGFGYDPHFLVPELGRTTAELPANEKNAISHRGRALRAILPQIRAFVTAQVT
jgi:XTP/dITP diphosphohydrolase